MHLIKPTNVVLIQSSVMRYVTLEARVPIVFLVYSLKGYIVSSY